MFQGKVVNKTKTHILFSLNFFLPKIVSFRRQRDIICQTDRPQMTVYSHYGAEKMRFVYRIIKARIRTHNHTTGHLALTPTTITRKHLSVTFIRTLSLSCLTVCLVNRKLWWL